jgi:hypothetical protein
MVILKYVSIINKIEFVYHIEYRHMMGKVQILMRLNTHILKKKIA